MWKFPVKFYWRQNEDCSLGDSISDSSEKLLQRGVGWEKDQYMYEFSEGGVNASKHIFLQKVPAGHKE